MNNLVLTVDSNGQAVVSSRKVAEDFGKEHKNVLENIRVILAAENLAAKDFFATTYENRGKQYPEYLMNRDGFTLLAMEFTGAVARSWRIKYIAAFNEMEAKLSNPMKLPTTYLEALEALVDSEKTKAIMAPKADYYDKLCDRRHLTSFRDTAKELKVGQKKLMTFLEDNDYIFRDHANRPKPYMKYIGTLFEMKDFSGQLTGTQTLVTVQGKQRFAEELQGHHCVH